MASFIKKLFILPVRFYQLAISPILRPRCAYSPSCSQYMIDAINTWGPAKGLWLGMKRIGRCHPLGGFGYDPVPENPNHHHATSTKTP